MMDGGWRSGGRGVSQCQQRRLMGSGLATPSSQKASGRAQQQDPRQAVERRLDGMTLLSAQSHDEDGGYKRKEKRWGHTTDKETQRKKNSGLD